MKKCFILVFIPIFTIISLTKAMEKEGPLEREMFYGDPRAPQRVPVQQKAEQEIKGRLTLINTTTWDILVEYEKKGNIKGQNVLAAASGNIQPRLILDNPEEIQTLTIKLYGRWQGLFSAAPIITPKNLMQEVGPALKASPIKSADLTISLPDKPFQNLRSFETKPTSIRLELERGGEKTLVPASYKVSDAFPRVAEAIRKGIEILPRYVLAVPENADLADITGAYERLLKQWEAEEEKYPKLQKFIDEAINLIKGAYALLKAEIEFNGMIQSLTGRGAGYNPPK